MHLDETRGAASHHNLAHHDDLGSDLLVRSFIGLVGLFLLVAGPVTAQPRFDFERTATLMPKTVLSSRVQVRLDLDPAKPTFSGDVTITRRVRKPVPAIVLHARDL